jgi:NADH dehydrogenase FAD-containing subunit
MDSSKEFMFRFTAPRAVSSTKLMPASEFFFPIEGAFQKYDSKFYTVIQGKAISLDTTACTITLEIVDSESKTQTLPYHTLILATGTRTHSPMFSLHSGREEVEEALNQMQEWLPQAKSILITSGWPTGIETAGELGEHLNDRAYWFQSKLRNPRVKITVLSGAGRILPRLRPAIVKQAESYLSQVGVEVVHNKRAVSFKENDDGTTTVILDDGESMTADIYIPAAGVMPNIEWLPKSLLTQGGYVKTNGTTLRVDEAGPRVYALGDVGSYTRGGVMDMYDAVPVALTNMKGDLLAAATSNKGIAEGKDRLYVPNLTESQLVPIGRSKGVRSFRGWRLPSFLVWLFKGRHYLTDTVAKEIYSGSKWDKAT